VCDTGFLRDVADPRRMEAAPRKHANRCFEQETTFVGCERCFGQG
jgi:hypothetical protein